MAAASAATSFSVTLDGILAQAHKYSLRPTFPCTSTLKSPSLPFPVPSKLTYSQKLLPYRLWLPSTLPPVSCSTSTPSSPQPLPVDEASATLTTTAFIEPAAVDGLRILENFRRVYNFPHGSLEVRLMAPGEVDATVELLAESYAESLRVPPGYARFLAVLIKQHVLDKQDVLPYAATLVGFYKRADGTGGDEEEEAELAATAEIFFDARGSNSSSPPTPTPPRDCPYICNMAVTKGLRRRGIGWQLLKCCEELICLMTQSDIVYLHCQMVDKGPFNMYTKAGYRVCSIDSILIWFTLQRRKYLMFKELIAEDKFD